MENFNINNISKLSRQFELFDSKVNTSINYKSPNNLKIKKDTLMIWRDRIYDHQSKILRDNQKTALQHSIFDIEQQPHSQIIILLSKGCYLDHLRNYELF